jgi:hypothetical protein
MDTASRLSVLRRGSLLVSAMVLSGVGLVACSSSSSPSSSSSDKVLLVGTFDGRAGQYRSIQSAVNAAKPGDWILVAPGDYHEDDDAKSAPTNTDEGGFGGVVVTTSNLHIRGMNRNTVVVDGTKAGSSRCSSAPSAQDFGAIGSDGKALGRNGIVAFKASGVSIENLTACNFLAGTGASGNEIWWDGGADTGKIGLHGYKGDYLTATSTYFGGESTAAQYGIFSSNSAGSASWDQIYASNMNDSGSYVGACQQQCGITIDHSWMEFNALGYSGTNSGGAIVTENSQFDNNEEGFDTNTQIGSDPPAPQDGYCPNGATSPITHTKSCWVFEHNNVHDNNNPNTPKAGDAAAGPTGTGMTISGGKGDTVMDNTFANNGAWGFIFVPFPDSDTPSLGQTCAGKGGTEEAGLGCVFEASGGALLNNTFVNDGYFGNPSNSDFGELVLNGGQPQNCFAGNKAPQGSSPTDLEQTQPTCNGKPQVATASTDADLLAQTLCDTGFGSCPAGSNYPQFGAVDMHPLPPTSALPSMPNPCAGVPSNSWCPSGKPA